MSVSGVFYLDKLVLPSSVEIHALGNTQLSAGIMSLVERGAGEVLPNFIATQQQKPTIPFTTTDLATLLGACGVTGVAIANATLYLKQGATAGRTARSTSSHKKVACTTAHMHWTTIRIPHTGRAEADVIITPIFDGTNAPFILTGSVALSGTIDAQSYFRAGPVSINGSVVGAIKDITINSGLQLVEEGADGDVYLTFVGTQTAEPTIEIRTLNMVNWASGIALTGTALNGTSGLQFWARKYSADGQMVANATQEHILFGALFGRVIPMNTQGSGSEILSDTFKVEVREDPDTPGSSLTIDTAAAIS